MLEERDDVFRMQRILARYTQAWYSERWHDFTPSAIRKDEILRGKVLQFASEDGGDRERQGRFYPERLAKFVCAAFAEYLSVRATFDPYFGKFPCAIDVVHSALLRWLLFGRTPTPEPPPILYSYPSHFLAIGEPVRVEVKDHPEGDMKIIIFNNGTDFCWECRDAGLIRHLLTNVSFQLKGDILQRPGL
jgi:hypothetical protein